LRARGYIDATSAEQLGKEDWKDPALLTWLFSAYSDMGSRRYVVVTYDNKMPGNHAQLLRSYGTTVAVIDKKGHDPSGLVLEEYWREVIHRHAHRFASQPPGTVFKYRCSDRRRRVELAG
jgi:hypothetical protein